LPPVTPVGRFDSVIPAASHVLMIEPVQFRFNPETAASNSFQVQHPPDPADAARLADLAVAQHRVFRDLLVTHGVRVTACRSLETTPDAPFCNNWFSTHPARGNRPPTLALYPLLAPIRRRERREDLVAWLGPAYPRTIDFSSHEHDARYLESTGSLCIDHEHGVAYAALSPRTDRELAEEWARQAGYELIAFTALDGDGLPYYHTNVMMFVGHGVAAVVLESIVDAVERQRVEAALAQAGHKIVPITRAQAAAYCGNCLALSTDSGRPVLAMSSTAFGAFSTAERTVLESAAQILHADLTAFEQLAGGSARCLIAELF